MTLATAGGLSYKDRGLNGGFMQAFLAAVAIAIAEDADYTIKVTVKGMD